MAMGTPVVSTSIGAQGLFLRHRTDILLADSAEEFVRDAAEALSSEALRQGVEKAGLNTVRQRLCWPMLGKQLSDAYTEMFCRSQGSPRACEAVAANGAGDRSGANL
jgi:glycosyltransferase involved in cell wall biosynthesis